ncbi:hypothetical protein [Streptococcus pneumoniae]|jgi:hypothetical protein|uniref:hypothetical protein n=1 Tax=Streptococcus pneumoniae TaxID=1313 RepID=UPI0005E05793|nr:hypothetical protein [Streptococcus pneumoniae]MDY6721837.1 hypothetical protein [Streptococcus pneumoniae]OAB71144.1 hypothetical protein AWC40_10250 [Streptococcus pneumoniae]OOD01034.1 hypothetical protein BWO98_03630 [Streptococcus pneumoniae]CKG94314.1 Uncharacterised protein [Streptococcus pneumoniae]CKH02938.1 Uncharacterised protein [Streptococcus pneumoniae]
MTANKLESREEVISYLVKKTNSSYQASFNMTEELEKFGLVKFEAGDNYFLKELTDAKPGEPEEYYSMPKELVINPEFKIMSADSKFTYTFLFH